MTNLTDRTAEIGRTAPTTLVELVDEDGRTIGTLEKLAAHRAPGSLHRAFSVFLLDECDRLLIQRRAAAKYHSPLIWSNSCCGHPLPGEAPEPAAARRVGEELGVRPEGLITAGTVRYRVQDRVSGLEEHEYNHLFVGRIAAADVSPTREEVAEVAYVPLDELAEFRRGRAFSAWFDDVYGSSLPALRDLIRL
jgi:isopentenyl-diphosphate delta-isomerase